MENERRVQQKAPASRYALLDELRGLDLVSMMLYHACWDMMFLFGIWMDWYAGMPGRLWQQTICWVFILLSGFCLPLGHRPLRRGLIISGAGVLVTAVTLLSCRRTGSCSGCSPCWGRPCSSPAFCSRCCKRSRPGPGWWCRCCCLRQPTTHRMASGSWARGRCCCRVSGMPISSRRSSAFSRGAFSPRITFRCCPGCFCSGQGPAFLHGAGPHGAAAPVGVPGAGLDGPALAFAVSAAPAGDLRRTFSRGSSFCIKGLTQPGSCGILSVVRRY